MFVSGYVCAGMHVSCVAGVPGDGTTVQTFSVNQKQVAGAKNSRKISMRKAYT